MEQSSTTFSLKLKAVFFSTVKGKYARGQDDLIEANQYLNQWRDAVASSDLTPTERIAELKAIQKIQVHIDLLQENTEKWVRKNQLKLLPFVPASHNETARRHIAEVNHIRIQAQSTSSKALSRLESVRVAIPLSSEVNQSMTSLCSTLQREVPKVEIPTSTGIPRMESIRVDPSSPSGSEQSSTAFVTAEPEETLISESCEDSDRPLSSRANSSDSTDFISTDSEFKCSGNMELKVEKRINSDVSMTTVYNYYVHPGAIVNVYQTDKDKGPVAIE